MPQSREEFVGRYGGIYEHSAWIAEETYAAAGENPDLENLVSLFARCVNETTADRKLALIRAHPDLAGKAAIAGDLTTESTEEQAAAGIDQCTPDEFEQFQSRNGRYRKKFGFPFVMAVRDANRGEILAAFAERMQNDYETEFATAIAEIHKIARLRLEALDSP